MSTLLLMATLFAPSADPTGTGGVDQPAGASPTAIHATHQGLPDHGVFSEVLQRVVQVPWVDYAALHGAPVGLNRYLEALASTPMDALREAPREEQLAFWINAYNACMLHRVVEHYPLHQGAGPGLVGRVQNRIARRPVNSVWQIRDVFSGPACVVAGEERSLDQIEHEIIRPMGEPRIHFAINCAARSCPPLVPEAYTGESLDRQLDARVRAFVRTPAQFEVRPEEGVLRLNPILNWFGEDFGGPEGVKAFFRTYLSGEPARMAGDPGTRLVFTDYDWTLNDLPR